MRLLLAVVLLAACGDNAVMPDAFDEGWGIPCVIDTPTGPCQSASGVIGWCIVENEADRPNGVCRQGCDGGRECPPGETKTSIPVMPNDCYCMP